MGNWALNSGGKVGGRGGWFPNSTSFWESSPGHSKKAINLRQETTRRSFASKQAFWISVKTFAFSQWPGVYRQDKVKKKEWWPAYTSYQEAGGWGVIAGRGWGCKPGLVHRHPHFDKQTPSLCSIAINTAAAGPMSKRHCHILLDKIGCGREKTTILKVDHCAAHSEFWWPMDPGQPASWISLGISK